MKIACESCRSFYLLNIHLFCQCPLSQYFGVIILQFSITLFSILIWISHTYFHSWKFYRRLQVFNINDLYWSQLTCSNFAISRHDGAYGVGCSAAVCVYVNFVGELLLGKRREVETPIVEHFPATMTTTIEQQSKLAWQSQYKCCRFFLRKHFECKIDWKITVKSIPKS